MALALDPRDVPDRVPPLAQRLRVLAAGALAARHNTELVARMRLPQPQVAVVRSTKHKARIERVGHREHFLHPLRVVYIARPRAFAGIPQTHRPVVGACDQFLPGRRPVDGHHRTHMPFVDLRSGREIAHVERVHVVVFAGERKRRRLQGRPGQVIRACGQDHLRQRLAAPQVIQRHATVTPGACQHIRLARVEPHHIHAVGAHRHRRQRIRAAATVQVPNLDGTGRGCKAR